MPRPTAACARRTGPRPSSSPRATTASRFTSTTSVAALLGGLLVATVLLVLLVPHGTSRPVAWRDVSNDVAPVTTADLTQRLFRTPEQFHGLFGSESQAPVDFSTRQLLLVSPGPRSSTGYSVRILSVTERNGKITVKVRERTPTLADHVEARVTYPYRLLSLPAGKAVLVDWVGR